MIIPMVCTDDASSDCHSTTMLATIEAMRSQEEKGYETHNYFHPPILQCPAANANANGTTPVPADADCRFRMAEWCYKIVDYCKFKREVVAVAMSCLDRFMCSPDGRELVLDGNRNMYQLAAMTALYSAIKLNEPEAMPPTLVANLSQGLFRKEQVEAMEVAMLNAIRWRVNPPTAIAFIHQFLDLLIHGADHHLLGVCISDEARSSVIELSEFQTEVAVRDADFIHVQASTVALASLLNSFDRMHMDRCRQSHIQAVLSEAANIHIDDSHESSPFLDVRTRLYGAMTGQSESLCSSRLPISCTNEYTKTTSSVHGSPRSVSAATKEA
jgi:hypothetical protein